MSKRVMLRSVLCIALVAALAAAYLPVAAQDAASSLMISAPAAGDVLSGSVDIEGTATSTSFSFYKVEYSFDGGTSWVSIDDVHKTAVAEGVLTTWDTTAVSNGEYLLQVVVVDNTGNFVASPAVAVTVSNAVAAEEEAAAAAEEEVVAEEEPVVVEAPVAEEAAPSWLTTERGISVGISSPVADAALAGTVSVEGTATAAPDVFSFYKVEFSLDGGVNWASVNDVYKTTVAEDVLTTWDTTVVPDGAYLLQVVVVDKTGNFVASAPVAVTVANAGAVEAVAEEAAAVEEEAVAEEEVAEAVAVETLAISSPLAGDTVSGTVDISGVASVDGFKYYKVEYSIDGETWVSVDTDYEHKTAVIADAVLAKWNTTVVPNGAYMLRVVVVDNTGNYTASDSVSITVAN